MEIIKTIKKLSFHMITEIKFDQKTRNLFKKVENNEQDVFLLKKCLNYHLLHMLFKTKDQSIEHIEQCFRCLICNLIDEMREMGDDFILCKKQLLESLRHENNNNPIFKKNIQTLNDSYNSTFGEHTMKCFPIESHFFLFQMFKIQVDKNIIQDLYNRVIEENKKAIDKMFDKWYKNLFLDLIDMYDFSINFAKCARVFIDQVENKCDSPNENKFLKELIRNYMNWWKSCEQQNINVVFELNQKDTETKTTETIDRFIKIIVFCDFLRDMELNDQSQKLASSFEFYEKNMFDVVMYKRDDKNSGTKIINTIKSLKLLQ